LSQISEAIAARQTQITQLQREIETLQQAAGIMVGGKAAPAKATSQKGPGKSKAKPQTKPKTPEAATKPKPKTKRKRHQWSAAEKAAIGKRMKKYWAKQRKAKG